jgi:hypothetical protein
MKLTKEEKAMLAGERGPVPRIAMEHQVKVGTFFGARDFVPSRRRTSWRTPRARGIGRRWLEMLGGGNEGRSHRAMPDHHRPARHRLHQVEEAGPGRLDGRARVAAPSRIRKARRADDGHLHQLPDGAGGHARRARRVLATPAS